MNRLILIPGLLSLVGFVAYCSTGPSLAPAFFPSFGYRLTEIQTSVLIRDGWPAPEKNFGTREFSWNPVYAIHSDIKVSPDNSNEFVSDLVIVFHNNDENPSESPSEMFPLKINRLTKMVSIFDKDQWQDYQQWCDENRNYFLERGNQTETEG